MRKLPFIVLHTHRHGDDPYLLWAEKQPSLEEAVAELDLDFDPDRDEFVEITAVEDRPEEPRPHIFIHLDGGIVQDVLSQTPLDYTIIDYDAEWAEEDDLAEIPQGNGETQGAVVGVYSASVTAAARMEELHQAVEKRVKA